MTQTPALPTLCDNVTQTSAIPTTAEIITQTDIYFDISEIPPGAPHPKLPWGYYNSCPQFNTLLLTHPIVHPEDFVTYGIMQEAPRRGTQEEWGQVAVILNSMVEG